MADFPIFALNNAIAAVCPIDGVAVVDVNDRSTWRIDYKVEATDAQKAAAQTALAAFDPASVKLPKPSLALVSGSRIVQLADAPYPVTAPLTWVDISSLPVTITTDWTYVNGGFQPPSS